MATEEPQYEVILSDSNMELRRYALMLIANKEVAGELYEAFNKGCAVPPTCSTGVHRHSAEQAGFQGGSLPDGSPLYSDRT